MELYLEISLDCLLRFVLFKKKVNKNESIHFADLFCSFFCLVGKSSQLLYLNFLIEI